MVGLCVLCQLVVESFALFGGAERKCIVYETLRRLFLRGVASLASIAMVAGVVAVVSVTTAAPASAATVYAKPYLGIIYPAAPKLGYAKPVYAYTWRHELELGLCSDSMKSAGISKSSFIVTGNIPGMTAANSARAKMLVNQYVRTTNKDVAAALAFSYWILRGDKPLQKYYAWLVTNHKVSSSVQAKVKMMLTQKTGPYKLTSTVSPAKILPGQHATIVARLTTTAGLPAPAGIKVTFSVANGTLSRKVAVTNSKGMASTVVTRTGVGYPHGSVVAVAPSWLKATFTVAAPGTQRLLIGGFMVNYTTKWTVGGQPARPAVVAQCTTNCYGVATVTLKPACVPAGASQQHWTWTDVATGKAVAVLTVNGGSCGSVVKKLPDGMKLQASYCISVKGVCTSAYVKIGSPVEIVCPPWAGATVTVSLGCASCSVSNVTFTVPASIRFYVGTVTIGDKTVNTNLTTGGTTNVPLDQFGVIKGQTVTVVVGFKAYRDAAHTQLLKDITLGQVTVTAA